MKKKVCSLLILVLLALAACNPPAPEGCRQDSMWIQVAKPNSDGHVVVSVPVGYGVEQDDIVFTDQGGEADYSSNFTFVSEETDKCQTHFTYDFSPMGDRYEVFIHADWQEDEPYSQLGEVVLRQG